MNTSTIVSNAGGLAVIASLTLSAVLTLGDHPARVETKSEASGKPRAARRSTAGFDTALETVTIIGRAVDRDGRPVADAVIQVVNDNGAYSGDRLLGKTTTGADGRFRFRAIAIPVLTRPPSAIPKPAEG